jgi:tight adherence protein B
MSTTLLLTLLVLAFVFTVLIDRVYRFRARKVLNQRLRAISLRPATVPDQFLKQQSRRGDTLIERVLVAMRGIGAVEQWLMRSGTEQSITQFAMLALQVCLGAGGVAGLLTGSAVVGALAGLLSGAIIPLRLQLKSNKRRFDFENQLPEALDFISRALRAGHGLTVAIGMVGDELPAPIGPEFKQVFDEVNFGIPDLNFFIISTKIHRETGGDLTEILESISNTIRERIKLQGRVRILSAEGKFSGVLLGALPFLIGGLMTLINPDYMSELWLTEKGQSLVMVGLVMIVLGFTWMRNIAKIKV